MINTPVQPRVGSSPTALKRHYAYFSAPTSPLRTPAVLETEEVGPLERFLGKDTSTVTMARVTYFFDDGHCGGFLSIPHLGRHGSAHTAGVARILERWLVEKTSNPETSTTIIPILEEPIEQIAASITERLHAEGGEHLASLAKVAIHVNTGHIFTLGQCCDDEGVQWAARRFQQEYPLFLDLTIHTVPFSNSSESALTRFPPVSSTSPYSATSYARAQFSPKSPRSTEILLHFQKINLDDE